MSRFLSREALASLAVDCPKCGVTPGAGCLQMLRSGGRASTAPLAIGSHYERRAAWRRIRGDVQ